MDLLRLASTGKYGTLTELNQAPARWVIQALHFEGFMGDLQRADWELNREDS